MNLSVTQILNNCHLFDKDFWLSYKTLEKLHPDFDSIKMNLLKAKRVDLKYLKNIDKNLFDVERGLLQKEWEDKSEEAKLVGTTTHEYIHNLFCTDLKAAKKEFQIDTDLYLVLQLEAFKNCVSGIFIEHRLEYFINNCTVIGIPDCFIIHDGVVDVIDWKTNDKISFKSIYEIGKGKNKKMKYPVSSLDDCDGVRYQLQLSIYMWMILLMRPDLKPGQLKIVWLQDLKIKKTFDVEYLSKQVEKLILWEVKNEQLNEKLKLCKEIKY